MCSFIISSNYIYNEGALYISKLTNLQTLDLSNLCYSGLLIYKF